MNICQLHKIFDQIYVICTFNSKYFKSYFIYYILVLLDFKSIISISKL